MLSEIVASTYLRVERERKIESLKSLEKRCRDSVVPDSFKNILTRQTIFISEVKFKSPSVGILQTLHDPVKWASRYSEAGTDAISVLTEPEYFDGKLEYLAKIRAKIPGAFLLMKDFVVDPYQIYQARLYGANSFLLLANVLNADQLRAFITLGRELGLTALVEVRDLVELELAYSCGSELVGVNNRNLKTMEVDIKQSLELSRHLEKDIFHISESGISSCSAVRELTDAGYRGFLIGTYLMKSSRPEQSLRELRSAVE